MLLENLQNKLKEEMVLKNEANVSVIRMLISAIHNREIEAKGKGKEISEEDVSEVLKKELKKRNESALLYKQGNRNDLATKEESEAEFIKQFLPPQMGEEELVKIIEEELKSFPNATQKDFGNIMKAVMAKTGGSEGGAVSMIIKEKLQ
ncbi:MAG: GatB/YqeY domain-containing protein [Candidatus Paceibacterota bacterium]|jgi:hypothetical protein